MQEYKHSPIHNQEKPKETNRVAALSNMTLIHASQNYRYFICYIKKFFRNLCVYLMLNTKDTHQYNFTQINVLQEKQLLR